MLPHLLALVLAATPTLTPLEPVTAEVVSRGPRAEPRIALTFDACTTHAEQFDERITKILVETHTPATIFLGGKWTQANEEHVRYLASLPQFELGNHTWSHPHMTKIAPDAAKDELLEAQAEILRVAGREPTLWRPPFGEYDNTVVETAAKLGLTTVEYALPSGDPDPHATKEKLVDWVVRKAKAGDIVVMHLNHVKFHTAEALPGIIDGLRKRGFQFVTVSELIDDHPAPANAPPPAMAAIPAK